jgi:succinoglycan biosynthesis transport protein ExoP
MYEKNHTNKLELEDLLAIIWRRKWKFLIVFVPIFAAIIALAVTMPPVYRSSATLLIEAQDIPESAFESSVGGYVEARLAAIEKRILSTESLKQIAEKAGILPGNLEDEDIDDLTFASEMRDRILRETTVVEAPNARGPASTVSFIVAYDDGNPVVAQKVASELADLYISENSRNRIEMAEGVTTFLEEEVNKVQGELNEIETKLASFKQQHFAALPDNFTNNMRSLDATDQAIAGIDQLIQQLESSKFEIERQLRLSRNAEGIELIQQSIDAKRFELSQLQLQYQDAHPDIIALKSAIKDLETVLKSGNISAGGVAGDLASRQARATDSNMEITLKLRLEQTLGEIELAKQQKQTLMDKKSEYEDRVVKSPDIEQNYQQLTRDYESAKQRFREIKDKQMNARLSLQLEKGQRAERFVVIEPAFEPSAPIKPNRPALGFLGFVLAFGFGVIAVAASERYDTRVHGAKGIAAALGAPPLASIPMIDSSAIKY